MTIDTTVPPLKAAELIIESEVKERLKKSYRILGIIKIGRSPDPDERPNASQDEKGRKNDVILPEDDLEASRWHGVIRKVKEGYEYEDHSTNGTIICTTKWINNSKIRLRHGDKIIISQTQFRFKNPEDQTSGKILMDWLKGECPG